MSVAFPPERWAMWCHHVVDAYRSPHSLLVHTSTAQMNVHVWLHELYNVILQHTTSVFRAFNLSPWLYSTRWTDRNAIMLQGKQSAASPYLLWGFIVPLTSDEIPILSDFSIVFTVSESDVWVHLWITAKNNAFLSVIISWTSLRGESIAESSAVNFPILLVPDNTTIYSIVKKINETGSVQNKKPQVNKRVLIGDKLNEIGFH